MVEGFACFKNKAIAQLEDEKEEASMDIAEMKSTICLLNRRVSKLKVIQNMTNVRKNMCKEINEDNMYLSYNLSIRNRSHNSGNLTQFIVMFGAHVLLFNCKSELSVQTRDNYAYGNEQTQTILRYGQKNYYFEDCIASIITFCLKVNIQVKYF